MNDHLPRWKAFACEYAAKSIFYSVAILGAALVWLVIAFFAGIATIVLVAVWPLAWLVSPFFVPTRRRK